jgi:hypothetical protein
LGSNIHLVQFYPFFVSYAIGLVTVTPVLAQDNMTMAGNMTGGNMTGGNMTMGDNMTMGG